jgi:DNA-binding NtrC family response regulator
MGTEKSIIPPRTLIVGSNDFTRFIRAKLTQSNICGEITNGPISECWGLLLAHRPDILIFEVGYYYNERSHDWVKRLLLNVRERFNNEIYIIAALTSSERSYFAGDLLFKQDDTLEPSGIIDSFVITPPTNMPSIATAEHQLEHAISLYTLDRKRLSKSGLSLPYLGHQSWVQSLADPLSRELWMRWLPRYASYVNESPLIIGPTGAGKTKLAYAIHTLSGRSGQFISITPRDFSSSELVQAELFGAVAGAYTGAIDKWGLVRSAEKGTLFIDELQSIDKDLQGKLITFIENKIYRRVGSAERVEADVRFVFASNMSIDDMIKSNILREDFAYRLERVQLNLLPLMHRRLDIPAALAYALAKVQRQRPTTQIIQGFTLSAYRKLFCHSWPGNLRQLENSVAQLCEIADINELKIIDENAVMTVLGAKLNDSAQNSADILSQAAYNLAQTSIKENITSLEAARDCLTTQARLISLEVCGGDCEKAAAMLDEHQALLELAANNSLIFKQHKEQ